MELKLVVCVGGIESCTHIRYKLRDALFGPSSAQSCDFCVAHHETLMAVDRVSQAVAARLNPLSRRLSPPTLSGATVETGLRILDAAKHRVQLGHLIEVVGASAVGKTQLLHVIAARALRGVYGEGIGRPRVCWFDLNGGLDVRRMATMIQGMGGGECDDIRQRIHGLAVYRVESTLALCAGLNALDEFSGEREGERGVF